MVYWDTFGPSLTDSTLNCAINRAKERSVSHLVVASTTGKTARRAHELMREHKLAHTKLVVVSHHTGYREPGVNEFDPRIREELASSGVPVLTTTHLMANIERGMSRKFQGIYPGEIVAYTLRMFGQGTKVCVECSVMALDAGLIPYGKEIVAVAGSGRGADSALLLRPSHAHSFFDTEILEVICKPRVLKG